MEEGEKYACAELMVNEIKSAGGIMPKVSQTLAMKPDVVKEPRERSEPTLALPDAQLSARGLTLKEDDWEAIQFLGNDLLKLIHESLEGDRSLIEYVMSWKMNETQIEEARHDVSVGYDSWQAIRQGLGAVMDEFDLRIEDLNAQRGRQVVKSFDADSKLKQELGIDGITFDVPKVLMTKSRYIMLQSFAKGDTLTSYHASISGQSDKIKDTRWQPVRTCTSESCVRTSLPADDIDVDECTKKCKTVECIKSCEKYLSPPPAEFVATSIVASGLSHNATSCHNMPQLRTMNPVVLSLFAALFTNDLLDLKARQENIKQNDPKEPGTTLPDYVAVMLRSLTVFLGMIQAQRIFAQRFLNNASNEWICVAATMERREGQRAQVDEGDESPEHGEKKKKKKKDREGQRWTESASEPQIMATAQRFYRVPQKVPLHRGLQKKNEEKMVAKMTKYVEEGDVDPLTLGSVRGELIVADIQGVCKGQRDDGRSSKQGPSQEDQNRQWWLSDPQVLTDGASYDFGRGDLGLKGMQMFFKTHKCGWLCKKLGLKDIGKYKEPTSRCYIPGWLCFVSCDWIFPCLDMNVDQSPHYELSKEGHPMPS
eukprot:Skav217285  [mRNA]  locus=scaffold120:261176:281002:+ [translate_table: standard]